MYTVKFNPSFDSLASHRNAEHKEIMRGCDVCMILISTEKNFCLPVELHDVRTAAPLKPDQVPLNGILSLQHTDCTTQIGVGKLAESLLSQSKLLTGAGPKTSP